MGVNSVYFHCETVYISRKRLLRFTEVLPIISASLIGPPKCWTLSRIRMELGVQNLADNRCGWKGQMFRS